jgi:hypothetical protein
VLLFKAKKYDIIKALKKSHGIIAGVLLGVLLFNGLFVSTASASILICVPLWTGITTPTQQEQQQYGDCLKSQQETQKQAQLQKEYSASCQSYIDERGGHGSSVYNAQSGLCKTTCDAGYQFANSSGCVPSPLVTNGTVASTQPMQQPQKTLGLTTQQVQAIIMLLQAFGADQTVIARVEASLRSIK